MVLASAKCPLCSQNSNAPLWEDYKSSKVSSSLKVVNKGTQRGIVEGEVHCQVWVDNKQVGIKDKHQLGQEKGIVQKTVRVSKMGRKKYWNSSRIWGTGEEVSRWVSGIKGLGMAGRPENTAGQMGVARPEMTGESVTLEKTGVHEWMNKTLRILYSLCFFILGFMFSKGCC